eukprot:g8098.t1
MSKCDDNAPLNPDKNSKAVPLSRRTSYYDADEDKYYLHESGKEDPGFSSLHSLNGALRGKTLTIERLEKEINEANEKINMLEQEKRNDVYKVKQLLMEKTSKQNSFIETMQQNHKRDIKVMKEKLAKQIKIASKLGQSNNMLSDENTLLKQQFDAIHKEHARAIGDKDGLMHQIQVLSGRLSKSHTIVDAKNRRVQELEQAVIRLGSRMELLSKENKRLNDINDREQSDRDELLRERGSQLSTITALLETRTSELGAVEYEKAQVEALVDALRAEIQQYRRLEEDKKNSAEGAMNAIDAAVEHMKKQLEASNKRNQSLESKNADLEKRLNEETDKFRGLKDAFLKAEEGVRRIQDNHESVQRRLENEIVRNAELEGRLRELRNENGSAENYREQLRQEQISKEHVQTELNDRNAEVQKLELTVKNLNLEIKQLNGQLRQEESKFTKELQQEKVHEMELEQAMKEKAKVAQEHAKHHFTATAKICRRLYALRTKQKKMEVFFKWLSKDHRELRNALTEQRNLVKQLNRKLKSGKNEVDILKHSIDVLKLEQEHEIEELKKNSPEKDVSPAPVQKRQKVTAPVEVEDVDRSQSTFGVQTQTEQLPSIEAGEEELAVEADEVQSVGESASPNISLRSYNDKTFNFSQLIDEGEQSGSEDEGPRPIVVKKWKKMQMPSGDAEGFLQSFINRANALRDEAAVGSSPGILRNTQQLITDVAERIAIETYDTGEYLYDISIEMQPTIAEAYRLRLANSNSSKIAEIKGKAAAVSSVARTRIRAALHLSRDGMLSWLLTIFSNAIKLLIELQTPGQVLEDQIGDGDAVAKERKQISNLLVAQSSEELIRICSEQWTKRRWPHTDPNANLLEEVRADVQVAAEEEYWRRYVETVSGHRLAGNELERQDFLEVEEPRANIDFWSYLDPLPQHVDLALIERHIWSLVCLVNQQQVTETLGEIRLRRYDIHRKLLDTA